jgi:arylsulfatase A-like enzyme
VHGLRTNTTVLPSPVETLAQKLGSQGYRTGAFVSIRFLLDASGLQRGFATADHPEQRRDAVQTTRAAIAWLQETKKSGAPFFAWVHYFDAHSPYPLTPWARHRLRDYRGKITGRVSVGTFGLGLWIDDPADTHAITARYDGLVNRADQQLGRLLGWARSAGLLDNTVVIVTADHGQALGEHRQPGHGAMWESVLHVPLVIWDGRDPTPRRVDERVGLVDLTPTVLELAGIPAPAGLQGRSLVPALHGDALPPRPYFSQHLSNPRAGLTPLERRVVDAAKKKLDPSRYDTTVYEGSLKMMDGSSGTVLFDVAADPDEASPVLASDRPAEHGRLKSLIAERRSLSSGTPEAEPVPDDVIEALRVLGYGE